MPCKELNSALELTWLFMSTMIAHYGMLSCIISDYDCWFLSWFWKILISALGCNYWLLTAYHPQIDG